MIFDALKSAPRLLAEIELRPAQGTRFQPTGFPDLGAATYEAPQSGPMLLVESAQSMANRLEAVCWDETADELIAPLKGLPYVVSNITKGVTTNSILEAHRLNSPYIVKSDRFDDTIRADVGFEKERPFDRAKLATALLKYDPSSLVHGIFLEKIGGTVRLPRVLSSFIEARNVSVVAAGGVKVDRIQPASSGDNSTYGKAAEGYGNVPFHRDEYTGELTAYFNVDLALIRGLGLPEAAQNLVVGLCLLKIRRFLSEGLRLRTACDLTEAGDLQVTAPADFVVPSLEELEGLLPRLIEEASPGFANPRVTKLNYTKK